MIPKYGAPILKTFGSSRSLVPQIRRSGFVWSRVPQSRRCHIPWVLVSLDLGLLLNRGCYFGCLNGGFKAVQVLCLWYKSSSGTVLQGSIEIPFLGGCSPLSATVAFLMWGSQSVPVLGSLIPDITKVSYSSGIVQMIGKYFGLCVLKLRSASGFT